MSSLSQQELAGDDQVKLPQTWCLVLIITNQKVGEQVLRCGATHPELFRTVLAWL